MPLLILLGHGAFRTSYGYFIVPADVEVQFFVADGIGLDNDAASFFERKDLTNGITDPMIAQAKDIQKDVQRIVMQAGDEVKNYKLESILDDWLNPRSVNALRSDKVWTPGQEGRDAKARTYLANIVWEKQHLGTPQDPLVLQWCGCRTNFARPEEDIDDKPAAQPVPHGRKLRDPNTRCCYITTATCLALGLGDDCEPLKQLRWFRDQVVSKSPQGASAIEDSYATAPKLVRAIEGERDPVAIYRELYCHHLSPALAAIDRGDYTSAYLCYERLVALLRRRYLRH
jgi:hypothetical protein